MKFSLTKILLILVGLFIALLASEKISQWYLEKSKLGEKLKYIHKELGNYHHPNIGCYDKDLGWGLKANSEDRAVTSDFDVIYSINSGGIRDKEIPYLKPEGEFRILALGESTVMGEGIKYGERFTEIIEKALKNVEVVNMGVWGFGMDQSFLQLKRDGFKYHPDLVVLFVIDDFMQRCKDFERCGAFKPRFILNDTKDGLILQDLDFINKHFTHISHLRESLVKDIEKSNKRTNFLKNSKLYTLVSYYKRMKEVDNKLRHKDKIYWENIYATLAKEEKIRKNYSKDDFNRLIFLILKKYQNLCREHKVNFMVVYIDDHKPTVNIKDFCNKLKIPYLDLSGILANAGRIKSLRFQIDPHYNSYAHRVIGEYTSNYLKKEYSLEENKDYLYKYLDKF